MVASNIAFHSLLFGPSGKLEGHGFMLLHYLLPNFENLDLYLALEFLKSVK